MRQELVNYDQTVAMDKLDSVEVVLEVIPEPEYA